MDGFKSFLAGLLGFILFFVLIAVSLSISLDRSVLNKRYVLPFLEEVDLSELMEKEFRILSSDRIPPEIQTIVKKELSLFLEAQASLLVESFYDYVQGQSSSFNSFLDFSDVKSKIKTEVLQYLNATYGKDPARKKILEREVESLWSSGSIPDKLDVMTLIPGTEAEERVGVEELREWYALYKQIRLWGLIYVAASLLLIILLRGAPSKFLPSIGAIALVTGIVLFGLFNVTWLVQFLGKEAAEKVSTPDAGIDVFVRFVSGIFEPLKFLSAVLGIGGLVMIITGNVIKRQKPDVVETNDL